MSLDIAITLTDDQLADITAAVAERVLQQVGHQKLERLLTVDETAEMLQTSTDWVRRHQADLGAIKLSEGGGRNPIRFRMADVERFIQTRQLKPSSNGWRQDSEWSRR